MNETIEKLASQLVLVDPTDLVGLAKAHSLFEELAQASEGLQAPWVGPLCKESADLLQDIIMLDAGDPAAALNQVVAAATALEQLILGKCDPDDIALPDFQSQAPAEQAAENPSGSPETSQASDADTSATNPSDNEAGDQPAAETQSAGAADEPEPDNTPVHLTGDLMLIAEFITEACEHLESADQCLLTIEEQPDDIETVNALFRAYHTIKGVAGFLDLADVMHLAHQTENLLDAARQGQFKLEGARLDTVFDATDMMKRLIGFVADAMSSGNELQRDPNQPALITLLTNLMDDDFVAGSTPAKPAAEPTAAVPDDTAAAAPDDTQDSAPKPEPPATKAQSNQPTEQPQGGAKTVQLRETVKVDSARLDVMIDAIGELVIAEAMVTQSPKLLEMIDEDIERRFTHLSKITRELQEMATSLRLVPIRSTFQRMARLARDTAKKLDKNIEFVTSGDETELDKNVVDQVGDPLVHMVRNAVDHGLEDTEQERVEAGKPAVGRVELRAFHKGGSIYIEIADDGAGLDRNKLIKKAVERGIITEDQKLTDQEAFQLIMEPGFSTAAQVSDVSGRGVGMDVVRKNIQKMRGQIEIQSTPGKGTTFSIRLPLTLAIIDGMVVRVANRRYVIPLLSITRMLRPEDTKLPTVFEQAEMLETEEGLIPLYRVHRLFDIQGAKTDPTQASVVVVEHEGKRMGLLIDELLGQQQIVIKSLGESMRGLEGIAGGAIMPDGRVGLILDLDSLIRLAGSGSVSAEPREAA
ncbi:MAG: chemotaxis protein CheW [Phycisphaeraceae bacterium]|nr:chemotaxis protein CheW [Phycisphaeraceae bacterium]